MYRLTLVALLAACPAALCRAADDAAPVNDLQSTESFVGNWVVLGMFDNPPIVGAKEGQVTRAGFDTDYLTALGGEDKAKIEPGTIVDTPGGKVGPAKLVKADPAGYVQIDPLFRDTDFKVAYAYCEIRSDRDQTAYGHSGSNDGIKIWVNGEKVLSFFTEERNAEQDQNHFVAKLHKGLNPVLVKIDNKREDWNFMLELYGEEYEKARFPGRVRALAVTAGSGIIPAADGSAEVTVEFAPHSPAFSPEAAWLIVTLDGKELSNGTITIGSPKRIDIPREAGEVFALRASIADFHGKALAGETKLLHGDVAEIGRGLSDRLARLVTGSPRGMSVEAWARHIALARYYSKLLDMGIGGSGDEHASAVLRARDAAPRAIIPLMAEIVGALESGRDLFTNRRNVFRTAYVSTVDGSAQPYVCCVPEDYDASRTWPLSITLHGSGGSSGPVGDDAWKHPYIRARADGRGMHGGYHGLAELDILEVIADVERHYNVDRSRITISGSSMGGYGTWWLASRHPDLFAAAAPYCGWPANAPIQNLANVPTWVLHDSRDPYVPIDQARWPVRLMRSWGYPVRMNESEGFGHNAMGGAEAAGLDVSGWLASNRRPETPAEIVYSTETPARGRAYWVEIAEFADPSLKATVRARATEGNELYLNLTNVETLAVDLRAPLFDGGSPLEVTVDSAILHKGAPLPDRVFVHRKGAGWELLTASPVVEGPVRRYEAGSLAGMYNGEPLLIVLGTADAKAADAMARFATELSGRNYVWAPMDFATIPVKKDTEVTDDDIRTRNLILVGGPSQNAITARMAGKLAAEEKGGKVTLDGKLSYDMAGRGYTLFHYNPLAPGRLVFVVSSPESDFFSLETGAFYRQMVDGAALDFVLVDIAKKRYARVISWDNDWKPAERFLKSAKLPAVFGGEETFWNAAAPSIARAADADFAVCPRARDDRGVCYFDTDSATWADMEAMGTDLTLVRADVTGEQLLSMRDALAKSRSARMIPLPDDKTIDPGRAYRIAMPDGMIGAVKSATGKNLNNVEAVGDSWYDDFRRRAGTK